MLISAPISLKALFVFLTNPPRGHFLFPPSLGPEMTSQMVPGPSSLLLVTETVSYPALSFMWLSQKTWKIWLMLILQMRSALTNVQWTVCSYLPQAAACCDAFCLSSKCLCSPPPSWKDSLGGLHLNVPFNRTSLPSTSLYSHTTYWEGYSVHINGCWQYSIASGRKELRRVLEMLLYSP